MRGNALPIGHNPVLMIGADIYVWRGRSVIGIWSMWHWIGGLALNWQISLGYALEWQIG